MRKSALISLVVLVTFSLMACTQTYSWKPVTSDKHPPDEVDPNTLIGKTVRFVMADSTALQMRVTEAFDQQVVGIQSNPYLPADTLVVNLRDVRRVERETAGFPRPKKGLVIMVGVVVGFVLVLLIAGIAEEGGLYWSQSGQDHRQEPK